MLLSMTGFGEAHCRQGGLTVAVEVRAINNRFFKLSIRGTEGCGPLEPRIEEVVRQSIRRGTVQVNLRLQRLRSPENFQINAAVLGRYRVQLQALRREWDLSGAVPIEALLSLPGVIEELSAADVDPDADWPAVRRALEAALENLARMRSDEGRAMAADLEANRRLIAAGLDEIERRAPAMLAAYGSRLEERLRKTLAEFQVTLDPADVIKEISLFADRADVAEEVVRLRSHLEQFAATMALGESSGRKLEFLTQEMLREANTIGSKANDREIAKQVIEIKTAIERIREMIQNVE
ncbi:MAG: YicC/YloC family endoribonuclease [Thermoguttaceae bacterium]